jgi:hypothetical protein
MKLEPEHEGKHSTTFAPGGDTQTAKRIGGGEDDDN